jgi:hypothetical protein
MLVVDDNNDVARSQRIRYQPWGKQIFIVAVTGLGQEGDKQRALERAALMRPYLSRLSLLSLKKY